MVHLWQVLNDSGVNLKLLDSASGKPIGQLEDGDHLYTNSQSFEAEHGDIGNSFSSQIKTPTSSVGVDALLKVTIKGGKKVIFWNYDDNSHFVESTDFGGHVVKECVEHNAQYVMQDARVVN
ncbi:hypothetical protein BGZ59_004718, partial [Podila verticillata]